MFNSFCSNYFQTPSVIPVTQFNRNNSITTSFAPLALSPNRNTLQTSQVVEDKKNANFAAALALKRSWSGAVEASTLDARLETLKRKNDNSNIIVGDDEEPDYAPKKAKHASLDLNLVNQSLAVVAQREASSPTPSDSPMSDVAVSESEFEKKLGGI